MISLILFAFAFSKVAAECPNACSSHGRCGSYDMCTCYRNWMADDCSERVCQFGLAHVDTPKGDLDASGDALSNPETTLIVNDAVYPYGTTEQFPMMYDSDQSILTNSGHYYMECSNKGICDRSTGTCSCFDGYDGSSCQRASCPNTGSGVCSSHGTCESISEIAARDNNNLYNLWDQDSTMGCVCDGGYQGANCEEEICKFGADPLYSDGEQNIRHANWTYSIYTTATAVVTGNYAIIFSDAVGNEWTTEPIDIAATCDELRVIFEEIPNNVIPSGSMKCLAWGTDDITSTDASAVDQYEPFNPYVTVAAKYTIAFPSNPGNLAQMKITKYLDGTRPTLYTDETTSTLGWFIYSNGFYGEETDYVSDICTGVTATLTELPGYYQLAGMSDAQVKLLKACLGDANGDTTDNVDTYNWDYGTTTNPHLIKLVDTTQDQDSRVDADPTHFISDKYPVTQLCNASSQYVGTLQNTGWCDNLNSPGFYAVMYFASATSTFNILTRPGADYSTSTTFYIFTTTGYLAQVQPTGVTEVVTTIDNAKSSMFTSTMYVAGADAIDCETNSAYEHCIDKGDMVMAIGTLETNQGMYSNPVYPQMYTVEKISHEEKTGVTAHDTSLLHQIVFDKSVNAWYSAIGTDPTPAMLFKFYKPTGYNYVGQCSNRGVCATETGTCQCFPGYTTDNCGAVNALSN